MADSLGESGSRSFSRFVIAWGRDSAVAPCCGSPTIDRSARRTAPSPARNGIVIRAPRTSTAERVSSRYDASRLPGDDAPLQGPLKQHAFISEALRWGHVS